ncbi:MAG: DUF5915 domain-containing protein, partial [Oscillospiraceae bacterium]|nr:DUF5915 domain-containing protein [Oscillospiraceae bacterium]
DVELTDELRQEGAVRDIIRQIQTMRKEAGYAVEQRIELAIAAQGDMQNTITQAAAHIAAEVLAGSVQATLQSPDISRDIDIAGHTITIQLGVNS